METILVHLPAYREPELIPTIKDALKQAKHPERVHFGICRQYNPKDKFDNLDEFRKDPRFKIHDMHYKKAKGLPYARAIINEELLTDEDYVLQLDSHHRFTTNWDETLIRWNNDLEKEGYKPILTGYLPYYNPFNDPEDRTMEPWLQEVAAFYPHGTIFIRPTGIPNWKTLTKPFHSRFISGHFAFARSEWAKEIKHDPDLYFSGEEINLTVRSFTHGWDLFHPHRLVVWHATMREERNNMLVWDDQAKRGDDMWWKQQDYGRAKLRKLLGVSQEGDKDYDLTGYDLGTVRTLEDYEKFNGINFKLKGIQQYTEDHGFPPNPPIEDRDEWLASFKTKFYFHTHICKSAFPKDDYEFLVLAWDDENGEAVHREDWDAAHLDWYWNHREQENPEAECDGQEFSFLVDPNRIPTKFVMWAYSKSEGWAERYEEDVNYRLNANIG